MAIKVTESNYDGFISEGTAVLDIKSEWCQPCRMLSPIIEELSNEYENVKIGKLDADESSDIAQRLGIRSIPTILIFKNGEVVERHTGMITKNNLKQLIDKNI